MALRKTLIAVICLAAATTGFAQPIEPIPMGSIPAQDRARMQAFLNRFRSHGDYHARGEMRLHVHSDGTQCPHDSAKAPSMLIFARQSKEYIIKSNNHYRIWGQYVVFNKESGALRHVGCGDPFAFVDDSPLDNEALSRFAATPLLTVADMLREPQFIEGMLHRAKSIRFEVIPGDFNRYYQATFVMHAGDSLEMYFDGQAKFLTSARYNFRPDIRPVGVTAMFAEWSQQRLPALQPHRDQVGTHHNEVQNEITLAKNQATTQNTPQACAAGSQGPEVYAGTTGTSGMAKLLNWLCAKAGFESCAGND